MFWSAAFIKVVQSIKMDSCLTNVINRDTTSPATFFLIPGVFFMERILQTDDGSLYLITEQGFIQGDLIHVLYLAQCPPTELKDKAQQLL